MPIENMTSNASKWKIGVRLDERKGMNVDQPSSPRRLGTGLSMVSIEWTVRLLKQANMIIEILALV